MAANFTQTTEPQRHTARHTLLTNRHTIAGFTTSSMAPPGNPNSTYSRTRTGDERFLCDSDPDGDGQSSREERELGGAGSRPLLVRITAALRRLIGVVRSAIKQLNCTRREIGGGGGGDQRRRRRRSAGRPTDGLPLRPADGGRRRRRSADNGMLHRSISST